MKPGEFCAPHRTDLQRATGSCLTHEELKVVAKTFNSQNPDRAIPSKALATKRRLFAELSDRFKAECVVNGEPCWVQQLNLKSLQGDSFRPQRPSSWMNNRREWLNTYDILLVMRQYEKMNKSFRFVGVFPRDFAALHDGINCVSPEMCARDIARGRNELAFVFNHDTHEQGGSHWVALYATLDPKSSRRGVFYYDSMGRPPKPEVQQFMDRLKDRYAIGEISYNKKRQQFKGTECGMFAMSFLISTLEAPPSLSYKQVVDTIGNDDNVNLLRDALYTPDFVHKDKTRNTETGHTPNAGGNGRRAGKPHSQSAHRGAKNGSAT